MPVGIIGGTGFRQDTPIEDARSEWLETPHGCAEVLVGRLGAADVAFVSRHGRKRTLAPHRVNYQANIEALDMLGCQQIIATNAVGSLLPEVEPGSLCLPDQFLDFTRARPLTLFDQEGDDVLHVDMTEPYCPDLRAVLQAEAGRVGLPCRNGATYVCSEGPRFETPAEIRMFATLGGHIVGMTGVPEVVLAREAGLCYASLCIITNLAAGLGRAPLAADDFVATMEALRPRLWQLIAAAASAMDAQSQCPCCSRTWS